MTALPSDMVGDCFLNQWLRHQMGLQQCDKV